MKPIMILDNHFRKKKELFCDETYAALSEICEIHGGIDAPMPRDEIDALLPEASFYVSALPELNAQEIEKASKLKATIEVAGAFREGLDYASCLNNGIEVLSCSPGFRNSVAEMTWP
jgi:phosphoglycerate dehydrogenase-like enzyme